MRNAWPLFSRRRIFLGAKIFTSISVLVNSTLMCFQHWRPSLGSDLYFLPLPINSVACIFSAENSYFFICVSFAFLGLHWSREL